MPLANNDLPKVVSKRLPIYFELIQKMHLKGTEWVSSEYIARELRINPSTVRRDLSYFGKFGKTYHGYNVDTLYEILREILKINEQTKIVIIGAGNIGQALAKYNKLKEKGFIVKALFDVDPQLMGKFINGIPIYPIGKLSEIIKREKIRLGIVAVAQHHGQAAADELVRAGVSGILNFTPEVIKVPDQVRLENVSVIRSLLTLHHRMEEN